MCRPKRQSGRPFDRGIARSTLAPNRSIHRVAAFIRRWILLPRATRPALRIFDALVAALLAFAARAARVTTRYVAEVGWYFCSEELANTCEGSIGQLLKDDKLAKSLTATSSNFEQISGRLNRTDNTAGKLLNEKELYDKLNSTVSRLDELTKNLNEGKGTAGQLLHDTKLYDTMNTAASEIKSLIADIRKDPKKYLNVRVSIF